MNSIPYVEFYITNVCNLSCQNCNRFNNYAFAGHFKWDDFKDDYITWSSKIRFGKICILGGEPFANPDIINWINGITSCWPGTVLQITTNGTFINKLYDLYSVLEPAVTEQIQIDVSSHCEEHKQKTIQDLIGLFGEPVLHHHRTTSATNDKLIFENGLDVTIVESYYFFKSALEVVHNNITVCQSDPVLANKQCRSKMSHHFLNGKLYKCPLVTVLPEFKKQFNINLNNEDMLLLDAYEPATHDMADSKLTSIIDSFATGEVIPQCKFCPVDTEFYKIDLTVGKPKCQKL